MPFGRYSEDIHRYSRIGCHYNTYSNTDIRGISTDHLPHRGRSSFMGIHYSSRLNPHLPSRPSRDGWLLDPFKLMSTYGGSEGSPKPSVFMGFSIINHPFWGTPMNGHPHMLTDFPHRILINHSPICRLIFGYDHHLWPPVAQSRIARIPVMILP